MSPVCVVAFSSFMLTCLSPAHVTRLRYRSSRSAAGHSLRYASLLPRLAFALSIRFEITSLRSACISRLQVTGLETTVFPRCARATFVCSASNRSSSFHSYLLISSASHVFYLIDFLVALVDYLREYSVELILRGSPACLSYANPAPSTPFGLSVIQRHQMLQSSISHSRQS